MSFFSWCYHENERDYPFSGTYNGNHGDGETIHVYGFNVARVNDKGQIVNVEIYYDQEEFMRALTSKTKDEISLSDLEIK